MEEITALVYLVSGGDFVNDGVEVGGVVINSTDGSWGAITNVSATSITANLQGGTGNEWDDGDTAVVPTWTEQSVNNSLTSTAAADVRHDALGRTLTFTSAPPANTYGIRIRYTFTFVAGQVDSEQASIDRYGGQSAC